jgi:perosamine synthetase
MLYVFRCSETAGGGHVARCVVLAEALHEQGHRCVFWANSPGMPAIGKAGFQCISAPMLPGAVVVVDDYLADHDDPCKWRKAGAARVFVLDDHHLAPSEAIRYDRVLRQRPSSALIDPRFSAAARAPPPEPNIVVTFGQTDPTNTTETVLRALSESGCACTVHALIGATNTRFGPGVPVALLESGQLEVHRDTADILSWLPQATLCIGAGGVTALECAAVGVPQILIKTHPAQSRNIAALTAIGAAVEGAELAALGAQVEALLTDDAARAAMSAAGPLLVDGTGPSRLAHECDLAANRPSLAVHGGAPCLASPMAYGGSTVGPEDATAVLAVLQQGQLLTTGPRVAAFETTLTKFTGAAFSVAVSNGTAALHCATIAAGLGPGDEAVVATMSFVATANCVAYTGAAPVFADVDPNTLNVTVATVEAQLGPKTKAVIVVDFAGQPPADIAAIRTLCDERGLLLIEDASHALGAASGVADLTTYSFHAVKNITCGEGGAVAGTDTARWHSKLKQARNHGISAEWGVRRLHHYDVTSLGHNYRLTDLQCALGMAQLARLPQWADARRHLADHYEIRLAGMRNHVRPLRQHGSTHAWHIYVVRLQLDALLVDRDAVFEMLQAENVMCNVHYRPIHLQPLYATHTEACPAAEAAYLELLTLPLYPTMTTREVDGVVNALAHVLDHVAAPVL